MNVAQQAGMNRWAATLWRGANYHLQRSATREYRTAIKDGVIVPGPCVVCGDDGRVHGHHEDYAKPLEVVWLCPIHHSQRHRDGLSADELIERREEWAAEAAYYRARDAARRAWAARDHQLELDVLGEAAAHHSPPAVSPSTPVLTSGDDPCCEPSGDVDDSPSPFAAAPTCCGASSPSTNAKGGGATLADETRAAPQEGA